MTGAGQSRQTPCGSRSSRGDRLRGGRDPSVALQTQGQLRKAGLVVGGQVGSVLRRDLPPRSARGGGGQCGRDGGAALCPRCGRPPLAQLWPARGPRRGRMGTVSVTADRGTSMRHGDSLQRRQERRRVLGTPHACSANPEMLRHVQPRPRPLRTGSEALEARASGPWPIPSPGRLLGGQSVYPCPQQGMKPAPTPSAAVTKAEPPPPHWHVGDGQCP